ncbi:MAG: PQQ-binding-like beta-propeller repeat protein [Planctomycetaceae bacterium]|nr:PQQ-binding-like beta-propeller repeat protein [Planctomycetaceae bacterium]
MSMTHPARFYWLILCLVLAFPVAFPVSLTAQSVPLLSQQELDPHGLKRVWFHQLKLHSARGKIQNILLEGNQLFLTTSDGILHALNSETGQWLWSRTVSSRNIPLTQPAVNSRLVAVHNNLEAFIFNRQTGKLLLHIPLPESASASCEMSEHYLYVPMANQTMLIYVLRESLAPDPPEGIDHVLVEPVNMVNDPELDKIVQAFEDAKRLLRPDADVKTEAEHFILDSTHRLPITATAFGILTAKPLLVSQFYSWVLDEAELPTHEIDKETHQEFITWVTEQGFLYTARISRLSEERMAPVYRVDSAGQMFFVDQTRSIQIDQPGNKELVSRPAHSQHYPANELNPNHIVMPDIIVTGGRAAYVFAIDARTGNVRWRYPTQGQLLEPIAVIGKDVYAPTSTGVMHAFDLLTGEERWAVQNVQRFVSASQNRIYVIDRRGRLVCLDRATGQSIFAYDVRRFDHILFNMETDQIFLLTDTGLIQCLRERQFTDGESAASLRHRISSIEYAEAAKGGGESPKLWWVDELQAEDP